MTTRLLSSHRTSLRSARLLSPALLLALAACSASTSGGGPDDGGDDGDATPLASCVPTGAPCGGGTTRLSASDFDGYSAVLAVAVDRGDGAVVALAAQDPPDDDQARSAIVLSRGAVGAPPAWTVSLGRADARLDVAPDGTITIAGSFEGTFDALGVSITSEGVAAEAGMPPRTPALFAARLDRGGNVLAFRTFSREVAVHAVAHRAGRVAIAGHASRASSVHADQQADVYVAILDEDLAMTAEHVGGGAGEDLATDVAIAEDGAIAVTGRLQERVAIGKASLEDPTPGASLFLARIDPDGTTRGIVPIEDPALRRRGFRPAGARVGWTPSGGLTAVTFHDGGHAEEETGLPPVALGLYRADADLRTGTSTVVAGIDDGWLFDVAHFDDGRIVIAGGIDTSLAVGGEVLEPVGELDAFALVLDAAGTPTWATRFGDEESQMVVAVATTADGELVAGGLFDGTIAVGGASAEASSMGSAFIVAMPIP